MTREDAYKKFKKIDSNIKWTDFNLGYMTLLDDIYDDFEKELKQGQDNYNKLWDMYSKLKKENKELEEEIRNLTTELILNMLKENK